MAHRIVPGALQRSRQLAPEVGDIARRAVVRGGSEQASEAALADGLAAPVVLLDSNVVHVDPPMDGGANVGLDDHHRIGGGDEMARRGGQRAQPPPPSQNVDTGVAQDTETGAGDQAGNGLALDGTVVVVAETKECEVIVTDPFQERGDLLSFLGGQRRRCFLQRRDRLAQVGAHLAPVFNPGTNVGEDLLDSGANRFQGFRRRLGVDFEMHERLDDGAGVARGHLDSSAGAVAAHVDGWVDDEVGGELVALDLGAHRIDQKRHIVVDDIDDRVRRRPAVFGDAGVEYSDPDGRGGTVLDKLPQSHHRAVERFGRPREDVLGRDAIEDGQKEPFEVGRVGGVEALVRTGHDLADAIGLRLSHMFRHWDTVGQSREKKITRMSTPHKGAPAWRNRCYGYGEPTGRRVRGRGARDRDGGRSGRRDGRPSQAHFGGTAFAVGRLASSASTPLPTAPRGRASPDEKQGRQ